MMQIYNTFSCFIIGEGTLPLQCAEILLNRGHCIYGIISPDVSTKQWAEEKKIPCIEPVSQEGTAANNLLPFLRQRSFDYLFSIVNKSVLSEEILALSRQKSINYHDAPLPKYAGMYATSWAIMQREKSHGITWHVIERQVDAGDIVKQYCFEIASDETALTLNTKCYEAAINTFAELVDDLAYGRISAIHQDLDKRTYFPLYKRPPGGCVFSWNQSAENIDAFVRALEFGSYSNPLGLPKLIIERDFIIISQLDVLDLPSDTPPGTVTTIAEDFLSVSTTTHQVALRKLLTIDGQPLPISKMVAWFELYEGYKFDDLNQELHNRLTSKNALICRHEVFWVKRLSTLRPITLPYAVPMALRSQDKTLSGKPELHTRLTDSIPAEAISFLTNRPSTWRMDEFLLTAFAAYLIRLSGVDCIDLSFSFVQLKQSLAGLENFFALSVPLRITVNYNWNLEKIYQAVQKEITLIQRQKTYARDVVVRYPELRLKLASSEKGILPIAIEQVEKLEDYKGIPDSEFTMVIPTDGREYLWIYNHETVHGEIVESMMRQFATFLRNFVANPNQCLADVSLLTETEQYQMLFERNDTRKDYQSDLCIHQLFEVQVERTPEAVALVCEGEKLTYNELNQRANQLAHHLLAIGVESGTLVGVYIERSLEMIIGLLGILKTGGVYVPLDPNYPGERLAFMLADTQIPVLLTQHQFLKQLTNHSMISDTQPLTIVCLDSDWQVIAQQNQENPTRAITANHLAYVIYTSGSTGRPKGVQIRHQSVVNLIEATRHIFLFDEHDVWTVFHSYSFDLSVWEIWTPLLCGCRLVVVPYRVTQSPESFYALLCAERVTVLSQTPSAIRQLAYAKENIVDAGRNWCIRLIICGGEALPKSLALKLLQWNISVWNFYGPTEATVWVSIKEVKQDRIKGEVVTLGFPIDNIQIYLLDDFLQPVPVGMPGEICIGGIGLADGYLYRPELTAEKFIPDPFGLEPGARLYKTGDLARYLPDGDIEFLGRIDYQIKIRGFRVEFGEIEAVLASHHGVQETVVTIQETRSDESILEGVHRLIAYVVSAQKPVPTSSELHNFLKRKLPEYMVPSVFVVLDRMPRTSSGKINRRALPEPNMNRHILRQTYVAPRNPIEEALTDLWSSVLKIKHIGVYDNFFELGGHSLLGTQLLSRLRQTFQVELSLRSLFDAPTVASLAEKMIKDEPVPGQIHTIAKLRKKIIKMSPNEIQALLLDKNKSRKIGK